MVSDKEGRKNANTYLRGVKWVGDVASENTPLTHDLPAETHPTTEHTASLAVVARLSH